MSPNLLAGLMNSRARLNGNKVADLVTHFRDSPVFGDGAELRGRVLAVNETNAESIIGLMTAAWRRGAVPLLSSANMDETPWWKGDSGSFIVPEGVSSRWALPETCALIQATSGSSGTSQLVMRSHASFRWESRAYTAVWGGDAHPLVHCVRLEHSLGIGITLSALLADRDVFHELPIRANRLVGFGERVGVLAGTPSTLRVLHEAMSDRNLRPHTVFCGAGSLGPRVRDAFERRWHTPVIVGFGSTETGGALAGLRGIGTAVAGATLEDVPERRSSEPFQLKVRFPHEVLGYVGRPSGSRVWAFPDLVRRGDHGQLEHVARMTRTMRSREQTWAFGLLAEVLRSMNRDWRLVESSDEAQKTPRLILEGEPLSRGDEERIRRAGSPMFTGVAIRTVIRFPRNEVGKVNLAKLLNVTDGPVDPDARDGR